MKHRTAIVLLLASVFTACSTASPSPSVSPEVSMNPDDALLQIIRDAGTDMSRPRLVGHFLFFDTEEQARAAAADVPPEYTTEVYQTDRWVLRASQTVILNEGYIVGARAWW